METSKNTSDVNTIERKISQLQAVTNPPVKTIVHGWHLTSQRCQSKGEKEAYHTNNFKKKFKLWFR